MQKQQVFKVKGMQRDLSMANANGEFAYEIVNMRLIPAEENQGFSLTNEQGTTHVVTGITGTILGQCATTNSLIVFTTCSTLNGDGELEKDFDYIYCIYQDDIDVWIFDIIYEGDLNFHPSYKIEALFNYETKDIQKVYWIDGYNQLRCVNVAAGHWPESSGNNTQFDSVKEINSLPNVEIERVEGGNFTAGVLQYYITYYNEFGTESPIVYTSPLLYLAHNIRGANVNDQVSTAFNLKLTNLDTDNWAYIRIYATHRTSLETTPEGSIVTEIKISSDRTLEFIDYGSNRTAIAPSDLYFKGSKFVKAGTMTVKDQVMFLGNLDIESPNTIQYESIKELFDELRETEQINNFFSTSTRKSIESSLSEYQDTYYIHNSQLNNTESITHYKYGEKYRFGIAVMDKYGVWSNPIWIKDEFILTPPEQIDGETLELPCPTLNLSGVLDDGSTLWEKLQSYGVVSAKPLVVFPKEEERKIIAQGVVCPTVYNLKDRKENGPYAQASWFMRPNAPADLWGIRSSVFGKMDYIASGFSSRISHKSDVMNFPTSNTIANTIAGYYGAANSVIFENNLSGYDYLYDDFSALKISDKSSEVNWDSTINSFIVNPENVATKGAVMSDLSPEDQNDVYVKGNWVEFRHNYALRSKGWSFGYPTNNSWQSAFFTEYKSSNDDEYPIYYNLGMIRGAELDTSRFDVIPPVNRFIKNTTVSEKDPIVLNAATVKQNLSKLYFVTMEDPKTVHEKRKEEEDVSILVLYVHQEGTVEYVHIIETIKIPFKATIGTLPTVYGSPNVFINISNSVLNPSEEHKKFFRLKARADASITEFKNGERNYYTWEVREIGISKTKYIEDYMPETTLYLLGSESSALFFGKKSANNFSLGNASYYVDNSIVTLNSPEIELNNFTLNVEDSQFRITGLIPLTATASDISLEVESPSMDTFSMGAGLIKRKYHNTNIGYHGFKGIVGSNAYLTSTDGDTSYSLVQLSPWQTTGTLGKHDNTTEEFKSKDLLKKKILSNLRYSASTYFFNPNELQFQEQDTDSNRAYLKDQIIGWKPASTCAIQAFNSDDTSSIIKLNHLNYTTQSLVYKGNIDSIALLSKGDTNTLYENPIYSFRDNPLAENTDLDSNLRMNSPAVGAYSKKEGKCFYKEAQGASIKYKSSPHFVIGFSCLNPLWSSSQKIQETLPAWRYLNEEGIATINYTSNLSVIKEDKLEYGQLYEDSNIASLYHQDYIYLLYNDVMNNKEAVYNLFRKTTVNNNDIATPNYGWLWLGEIYRNQDPSFGGTSEYALKSNSWISANTKVKQLPARLNLVNEFYMEEDTALSLAPIPLSSILKQTVEQAFLNSFYISRSGVFYSSISVYLKDEISPRVISFSGNVTTFPDIVEEDLEYDQSIYIKFKMDGGPFKAASGKVTIKQSNDGSYYATCSVIPFYRAVIPIEYTTCDIPEQYLLEWKEGDTYYQRFDTLKTYAHDDAAQNSIVDITSFMVETRVNIDGRYDRNRGQESNLQMSPNNFNLMNDVYSQKDNFFTYRILDDEVQARTKFPNQITWSLSKTAGETIDSWLNVTMASVLDLDGTKGKLTALKTFNNNIIALQDKGISTILFNSRVQIPTSENVPIQIANSGKVDGQQIIMSDVGCQDKWSVVTTAQGLYFVDYYNKAIYRFTGKIEDLSLQGGFRGWCNKYITEQSQVVGYYDIKNKEVIFNDEFFECYNSSSVWLGFSELSNSFSSFYTYPYEARLVYINGIGVWLHGENAYTHQTGNYNELIYPEQYYGLIVCARQDSNTVKTFNNVEFRADTYPSKDDSTPYIDSTFDVISIETETESYKTENLIYHKYLPSNLKKKLRTWKANIPRIDGSAYKKFVNQWAKIGLWKSQPEIEKTILHDLAVIYTD